MLRDTAASVGCQVLELLLKLGPVDRELELQL